MCNIDKLLQIYAHAPIIPLKMAKSLMMQFTSLMPLNVQNFCKQNIVIYRCSLLLVWYVRPLLKAMNLLFPLLSSYVQFDLLLESQASLSWAQNDLVSFSFI